MDVCSPGLWRHRQGNRKFKTRFGYKTSSRPSWAIKKKTYLRKQMGQQYMTQPVKVFGAQSSGQMLAFTKHAAGASKIQHAFYKT